MTNNLIGHFYFKQTSNGNLIGEFSNNMSNRISTESADSINGTRNYIGNYNSTWQEKRKAHFARLTISRKSKTNKRIFFLKWKDNKGDLIFEGKGMLCDDILIGDYQSV